MSRTSRLMNCSPQAVFDVLTDGWTYATWVVGASRIRAVDDDFPAAGSKIHHSVGVWPMLINDETVVERVEAPHEIQLRAQAWPAGEADVTIHAEVQDGQTLVTIDEQAVSGPARLIPRPVEDFMLRQRNVETLKRLAFLAESGARSAGPREF
jgi:uncharacterized protein YndB with AHSA1/START domain